MRNIDCRSVQREVDEVGTNDFLSPAAHAHLQSCSACESLARKQTNLHAILAGLETVETPGDFEFRVRARLATERQAARTGATGNFSFGFRSAFVSMVLFIVAAALVVVSYRSLVNPTVPQQVAVNPAPAPASNVGVAPESKSVVPATKEIQAGGSDAAVATIRTPKHRDVRTTKGGRIGTRDFASAQAAVFTQNDAVGDGNPTAFPINASYQSLKVKVDDGNGGLRTISLPTVSFGSQRTLSQNAQPLLASSRGVW